MSPGSCSCPTVVPRGHEALGAAHLQGVELLIYLREQQGRPIH